MRSPVRALLRAGVVALLACWVVAASVTVAPPASAAAPRGMTDPTAYRALPLHVALGDSVAYGVGAHLPARTGYVARLHHRLQHELSCSPRGWPVRLPGCQGLNRVSYAVPGATTTDVLSEQLPQVLATIADRRTDAVPFNDVRVVTVTAGGNDVFRPVLAACVDPSAPACAATVAQQLQQAGTNLNAILQQLTAAVAPGTTVAVMTYYNPMGSCDLAALSGLAEVVLEGGPVGGGAVLEAGLNDIIRHAAAEAGAVVAETYGLLGPADLVGGQDCLHPVDSGHAIIADAFAEAITRG